MNQAGSKSEQSVFYFHSLAEPLHTLHLHIKNTNCCPYSKVQTRQILSCSSDTQQFLILNQYRSYETSQMLGTQSQHYAELNIKHRQKPSSKTTSRRADSHAERATEHVYVRWVAESICACLIHCQPFDTVYNYLTPIALTACPIGLLSAKSSDLRDTFLLNLSPIL